MRKFFILFLLGFCPLIGSAQMATFDATAAYNAINMLDKTTTTVTKLNDLKKITKETYDMVNKVSTVITTGVEIKNILQHQKDIINSIAELKDKVNLSKDAEKVALYNTLVSQMIENLNKTMLRVNNTLQTGTLKMNDYERLQVLGAIEKDLFSLKKSAKSIDRLIKIK